MVKEKITVINKSGIHMRPATELSKLASSLSSHIIIKSGDVEINPKSVLLLMSAGITKGTEIEVVCEGETEQQDLQTLVAAISSGLGEE